MIFPLEMRVSTIACSQLKGVIPKMTACKLKKWCKLARVIKSKRYKTNGSKTRSE